MNPKLYELKILYVEDDQIVRENTVDTLNYFFKLIEVATNGKEALELLKTSKPDVLITDYVMPYLNGYNLILEARKLYPKLIIFVTSSYTDQDKLLKCIPLNIQDYVLKPLDYHKMSKIAQTIIQYFNDDNSINILLQEPLVHYMKQSKMISFENEKILLSKQESDLVELLLESKGTIVSKHTLKTHLYSSWEADDNLLKNLLYRLRKKLPFDIIKTVKNSGYIIE